jgi:hypothetical protein
MKPGDLSPTKKKGHSPAGDWPSKTSESSSECGVVPRANSLQGRASMWSEELGGP